MGAVQTLCHTDCDLDSKFFRFIFVLGLGESMKTKRINVVVVMMKMVRMMMIRWRRGGRSEILRKVELQSTQFLAFE